MIGLICCWSTKDDLKGLLNRIYSCLIVSPLSSLSSCTIDNIAAKQDPWVDKIGQRRSYSVDVFHSSSVDHHLMRSILPLLNYF